MAIMNVQKAKSSRRIALNLALILGQTSLYILVCPYGKSEEGRGKGVAEAHATHPSLSFLPKVGMSENE